MDKCIQCNQCSFICPHAAIRPFLLDEKEAKAAPEDFKTKKAIGKGFENLAYRIQVSPLDCTGCGNCVDICPAEELFAKAEREAKERYETYKRMEEQA